ncbi:uncharacterized protein [Haliotis asinina]|uniref:uncharacterized protein n=1 Tax=Haliotis asinina TaxID=109174 RepID=UPI003532557D
MLNKEIKFSFNPPSASHMGGVWERLIRSVLNILKPMLHEFGSYLDNELYRTLLCEIEAILNSRPLTTVSGDPDDLCPLTPNHLLMMKPDVFIPPPGTFQQNHVYARQRWKRIQYLTNVFWSRWKKEYLQSLQQRQKWNVPKRNFQPDDIVLIKEDTLPRSAWSLGRVIKTEADAHGTVRSVLLKTRGAELKRPIHKLFLLLPPGSAQVGM